MVLSRMDRVDRLRRRGGWTTDDLGDATLGEIIDDVVVWLNEYTQEDYTTKSLGLVEAIITAKGFCVGQFIIASDKVADGVNYRIGELMENESSLANSAIRLIKLEERHLEYLMDALNFYLRLKEDEDYDQFALTNTTVTSSARGEAHELRGLDWFY